MNIANSTRTSVQWVELGPDTPTGIVVGAGPHPSRYLVFRERQGFSFQTMAIKLDETANSPAFSFLHLDCGTGIMGTWLGDYNIQPGTPSPQQIYTRRVGLLRLVKGQVFVSCTDCYANPRWSRLDDLMLTHQVEQLRVYLDFSILVRQPGGTALKLFDSRGAEYYRASYRAHGQSEPSHMRSAVKFPLAE